MIKHSLRRFTQNHANISTFNRQTITEQRSMLEELRHLMSIQPRYFKIKKTGTVLIHSVYN